jgi:hypothetical protein
MRLLFARPVPTEGRQPEILTAPAVHLPTLSVSPTEHVDGDLRVPRSPFRVARQHRRVSSLRLTDRCAVKGRSKQVRRGAHTRYSKVLQKGRF